MQLVEHRVEIEAKGEIPGKPTPGTAATDLYQQGEFFQTRPDEQDTSFDLTGGFLRLEADAIRDATASDSLFAFLPTAIEQKIARPYAPAPRHRQLHARESFLGKWPGDETEEQLLAALRELRS
jgi:hypothetical protein